MSEIPHFRLALTCAGGGTAGAYIAGVLDYLFETLHEWEKAKKEKLPDVPQHKVTIHVIGGNSAGSMSTALAVLNLLKNSKEYISVKEPAAERTGNLLYDSWVLLNDVGEGDIMKELLDAKDLHETEKFISLLNSKAIEKIIEEVAIQFTEKDYALPDFVDDKFQFLISLANMKGVPFKIVFRSNDEGKDWSPAHRIHQHKLIAHFSCEKEIKDDNHQENIDEYKPFSFLPLDKKNIDFLLKCARSSGALPFIFNPPLFTEEDKFDNKRIRQNVKKFTFLQSESEKNDSRLIEMEPIAEGVDLTHFFTVDGGTFNNEPFGEVMHVFDEQTNKVLNETDKKNRRLIMIDPFPNFEDEEEMKLKEELPKKLKHLDIFRLLPKIYKALRGQGLFKSHELLTDQSFNDENAYIKGMIFPSNKLLEDEVPGDSKNTLKGFRKYEYTLASEGLEGLAGFLSKDIRDRDFFLGRYNCQVYLRRYLTVSADDASENPELHQLYVPNVIERFGIKISEDAEVKSDPLPIIPDMRFYRKEKMKTNNVRSGPAIEIAPTFTNVFANATIQKVDSKPEETEKSKKKVSKTFFETPITDERKNVLSFDDNKEKLMITDEQVEGYHNALNNRVEKILKYVLKDSVSALYKTLFNALKKLSWVKIVVFSVFVVIAFVLALPILIFCLLAYHLFLKRKLTLSITGFALYQIKKQLKEKGLYKEMKRRKLINLKPIYNLIIGVGLMTMLCSGTMMWNQSEELTCAAEEEKIVGSDPACLKKDIILAWEFDGEGDVLPEEQWFTSYVFAGDSNSKKTLGDLRTQVYLDFPFLVLYSLFFGLFAYLLYRERIFKQDTTNKIFLGLGVLFSGAMLIGDVVENNQLLNIVSVYEEEGGDVNFNLLRTFTMIKWGSIGFIFMVFAIQFIKKVSSGRMIMSVICLLPFITFCILFFEVSINDGVVGYSDNTKYLESTWGLNLAKYNFLAILIGMLSLFVYAIIKRFSKVKIKAN